MTKLAAYLFMIVYVQVLNLVPKVCFMSKLTAAFSIPVDYSTGKKISVDYSPGKKEKKSLCR